MARPVSRDSFSGLITNAEGAICSSFHFGRVFRRRFYAALPASRLAPVAAIADFTGENDIDASAIQDYFSLLDDWLVEQNEGRVCG